jgi:nicotinamidase/pyrazinamidase
MSTLLVVIDPQNDFVSPKGSLSVPGAEADMNRLTEMLDRSGDVVDQIFVSLDSHHILDISHPGWWKRSDGRQVDPFTRIRPEDVLEGRFGTMDPAAEERSLHYLQALESGGRYPHVIWPEHCLIGDVGGAVWSTLSAALHRWERRRRRNVSFVVKGTNPWTEHFSAVRAEVPDETDPGGTGTQELVDAVAAASRVWVAGEARSHCVANTVRDLFALIPDSGLPSRTVLLTDATSDVKGFEEYGESFLRQATMLGMTTATTLSVL